MNSSIINGTYDTTKLISSTAIEDPLSWWAKFNQLLGGYPVVTILGFVGFILFLGIKRTTDTDTEAAVWAGLVTSVIGVLLWLMNFADVKLISFAQVSIFLVITMVALFLHFVSKRF